MTGINFSLSKLDRVMQNNETYVAFPLPNKSVQITL